MRNRTRLEIWVPIKGYKRYYEISNLGSVRSITTEKIKKQSGGPGTSTRYFYVTLYKNNVGTKIQIHRLVAKHFIPNPDNYPYVLHKNDDRTMNSEYDLKWGNQLHNHLDCVRNGNYKLPPYMRGTDQPRSKLNPKKVRKLRRLRKKGYTQERLATLLGVSRGTVRAVLNDISWRHVQ